MGKKRRKQSDQVGKLNVTLRGPAAQDPAAAAGGGRGAKGDGERRHPIWWCLSPRLLGGTAEETAVQLCCASLSFSACRYGTGAELFMLSFMFYFRIMLYSFAFSRSDQDGGEFVRVLYLLF
jgi:hypothetical protein